MKTVGVVSLCVFMIGLVIGHIWGYEPDKVSREDVVALKELDDQGFIYCAEGLTAVYTGDSEKVDAINELVTDMRRERFLLIDKMGL